MVSTALTGAVLALTLGRAAPPQPASPLEIRYLGNMGVALSSAGLVVVIDGFHRGQLRDYAAIPPELLGPLEGTADPFRSVAAGLATHRHLDHFAARSVAARLRSDSAFRFVAPAEALDSVRSEPGLPAEAATRLHPAVPPAGGRRELSVAGIRIEVLDLPHNPTRRIGPANVGYLIRLGAFTILHVGDADPMPTRFAPHRLPAERIDVAIVPYWYATSAPELIRSGIAPRVLVATHIGPAEVGSVKESVGKVFPEAIALVTPGERHTIGAAGSRAPPGRR